MEIWTYMVYINDVQLSVTFQRKSTETQFWSNVTKISWTQKPCSPLNKKVICLILFFFIQRFSDLEKQGF